MQFSLLKMCELAMKLLYKSNITLVGVRLSVDVLMGVVTFDTQPLTSGLRPKHTREDIHK